MDRRVARYKKVGRPNLAEVLSKRSATMIGAKRTQKILDSDTPEMTGNAPCRASKHGPTTLSFLDIMPNKFQKEQSLHGRMKPFACGGFAFHLPEWSTFGSWGQLPLLKYCVNYYQSVASPYVGAERIKNGFRYP